MPTESLSAHQPDAAFGLTTWTTVPAELRSLEMIRVAVPVALDGSGSDVRCDEDLQLAADELAVALIGSAPPHSDLHLSITHDATDAHIRMVVSVVDGAAAPAFTSLGSHLIAATVDDHALRIVGTEAVGTLRRALDSRKREPGMDASASGA